MTTMTLKLTVNNVIDDVEQLAVPPDNLQWTLQCDWSVAINIQTRAECSHSGQPQTHWEHRVVKHDVDRQLVTLHHWSYPLSLLVPAQLYTPTVHVAYWTRTNTSPNIYETHRHSLCEKCRSHNRFSADFRSAETDFDLHIALLAVWKVQVYLLEFFRICFFRKIITYSCLKR